MIITPISDVLNGTISGEDEWIVLATGSTWCLTAILPRKETDHANNRIPFTLTFHPHNHAVKSIILKDLKLLQNDPDTGRIFSQPPLISFKRDQNIGNFSKE